METLFEQWAGEPCLEKDTVSAHGSARSYYRLKGPSHDCIAAVNSDIRENEAFFYYTDFFRSKGIHVPEIYAISADRTTYLQQDLGNQTLYDFVCARRHEGADFQQTVEPVYRKVIDGLVALQKAGATADFSHAYPRPAFDRQSMQWDLNYFKYDFLKLAHIPFDEQLLETDFDTFIGQIEAVPHQFFMYRDFQSRNIMLSGSDIYFIDYQGGRQGAPHYDLASLLYDAKAEIPDDARLRLADYYYQAFGNDLGQTRQQFGQTLRRFVLLRIMQAFGAYGYRGLFEGKEHFVHSIAPALGNMANVLNDNSLLADCPELERVLKLMVASDELRRISCAAAAKGQLAVTVNSFSFKRGYPYDKNGNGGGFVFDCRALPNPGRYPQYRQYTGNDQPVIDFLQKEPEVEQFVNAAFAIVRKSVERYIQRGFENLQVNFGCTGGQHRSVYCAEQLAKKIGQIAGCTVQVHHLEQER